MTSLECNTEDDALSADELESTIGDMDEPTDTETESISDGKNHLYTHTNLWQGTQSSVIYVMWLDLIW